MKRTFMDGSMTVSTIASTLARCVVRTWQPAPLGRPAATTSDKRGTVYQALAAHPAARATRSRRADAR